MLSNSPALSNVTRATTISRKSFRQFRFLLASSTRSVLFLSADALHHEKVGIDRRAPFTVRISDISPQFDNFSNVRPGCPTILSAVLGFSPRQDFSFNVRICPTPPMLYLDFQSQLVQSVAAVTAERPGPDSSSLIYAETNLATYTVPLFARWSSRSGQGFWCADA